jgi:imidazolonepropionase-like amidohydrolase
MADMAEFMANAGALSAATYHASAACSVATSKGQLAAGYDADILAVDGRPRKAS